MDQISTHYPRVELKAHQDSQADPDLYTAAVELESTFIFEMLKSAGMGEAQDSFGGGAGEDQFSSLLLRKQAETISTTGGIGLTEAIYSSLYKKEIER